MLHFGFLDWPVCKTWLGYFVALDTSNVKPKTQFHLLNKTNKES